MDEREREMIYSDNFKLTEEMNEYTHNGIKTIMQTFPKLNQILISFKMDRYPKHLGPLPFLPIHLTLLSNIFLCFPTKKCILISIS